nr:elicitin-like protein [Pythium porphyrae]
MTRGSAVLAFACAFLAVALCATSVLAQEDTSITMSEAPSSSPALTNDMRATLRKVGSIACDESVRSRIFALLFEKNRKMHEQCVAECGYQFFPYTGELPTTEQVMALVTSTVCVQLVSGAILASFPECDIDFVSVRSSAEVFLRIKQDVDAQRTPPTQAQFYEFYNLNRVVNLLTESASLIEEAFAGSPTSAAVSLTEMTRLMNRIELAPGVTLAEDMTVMIDGQTSSDIVDDGSPDSGSDDDEEETTTAEPSDLNSASSASDNDDDEGPFTSGE